MTLVFFFFGGGGGGGGGVLFFSLSKKIRLDVSWESSARQRIHVKYQVLSEKQKYSRVPSAAVVIGT